MLTETGEHSGTTQEAIRQVENNWNRLSTLVQLKVSTPEMLLVVATNPQNKPS